MNKLQQHFYNVLYSRRDVRGEFLPDPIAPNVLARILHAAHHAPSVGLSQPWNFIVVRDPSVKTLVHDAFIQAHSREAACFEGSRQNDYRQLKLEGILDAPINICITADTERGGKVVLGKTQQADAGIYSTVCAVQNLWLAARAEELGLGWVSILNTESLRKIFALPSAIVPVAYVCLGYVRYFYDRPELEARNWEHRVPLETLVYSDRWGEQNKNDPLFKAIESEQERAKEYTLPPLEAL